MEAQLEQFTALGWILKRSLNNEETILGEVQKGEKAAVEEYNEVIKDTTLPPTTQQILTKHRDTIQNAWQSAKNFEAVAS